MTHHAPDFAHPDDIDWLMGRFGNATKFRFHPTPERPTTPNVGFLRYEPGAGFKLHKHDFAQIWYVIEGEFRMGARKYGPGTLVYMEDPHFEDEMKTETGGTVLFVQYPGPTTGAKPIYDGRMNLKAASPPAISSTRRACGQLKVGGSSAPSCTPIRPDVPAPA